MIADEVRQAVDHPLWKPDPAERYVATCHRVLVDLEEADILTTGERSARGTLTPIAPA